MRVLFLTHRLPYAPNRGDRVRAFHLLSLLRAHAEVHLISLVHDADEAAHVADTRALATSVHAVPVPRLRNLIAATLRLPGRRPTTHSLLDGPSLMPVLKEVVETHRPSVTLAYCSGMARLALGAPLSGIPWVLDMVDVDSAKWAALAKVTSPPLGWVYAREARCLAAFEKAAAERAVATMVVTEKERDTLAALAPSARIEVVGNGVDADGLRPPRPPADAPSVVFCGVMNYAPNAEGAVWMVRHVWASVRRRIPNAELRLVGANPSDAVKALADAGAGVVVTGSVPDVRPYLWESAVAAAPLQTARGVQNKVLEAIAAGLPVVVTPVVAEGLPRGLGEACRTAATPQAFADEVVALLSRSAAERRALAARADLTALSWPERLRPALDLLTEAASRPQLPGRLA